MSNTGTHRGKAKSLYPGPIVVDDHFEWAVEAILASRCKPGFYEREYLVKWEMWPTFYATWEPASYLTHCDDALAEYQQREEQRKTEELASIMAVADASAKATTCFIGPDVRVAPSTCTLPSQMFEDVGSPEAYPVGPADNTNTCFTGDDFCRSGAPSPPSIEHCPMWAVPRL